MFNLCFASENNETPLVDWQINVNGQECQCNRSITQEHSPIIKKFIKNQNTENQVFVTVINETGTVTSSNLIKYISMIYGGGKIDVNEDNLDVLDVIGKHFQTQKIIDLVNLFKLLQEMINRENILISEKKAQKCNDYKDNGPIIDAIKNDDIESFQGQIANLQNDDNTIKSDKSKLIDCAAYFGALKCFNFLLNNNVSFNNEKMINIAIAGGNTEIIQLCENKGCKFNNDCLVASIENHQHHITEWLDKEKGIEIDFKILNDIIVNYNILSLKYYIEKNIGDSVLEDLVERIFKLSFENNNVDILKLSILLYGNFDLKMNDEDYINSLFRIACEKNYVEIVKVLLEYEMADINEKFEVIFWKFLFIT